MTDSKQRAQIPERPFPITRLGGAGRKRKQLPDPAQRPRVSFVCCLMILNVLLCGLPTDARNRSSNRTENPPFDPSLQFASLGNNGDLLDRYTRAVTSSLGASANTFVLTSAIIARCADNDGCTVRMSYVDLDSGERLPEPPTGFTIDSAGVEWTLRNTFHVQTRGTNGDDSQTIIHGTAGYRCQFLDDYFLPLGNNFQLRADPAPGETQSFRCTLAIDD